MFIHTRAVSPLMHSCTSSTLPLPPLGLIYWYVLHTFNQSQTSDNILFQKSLFQSMPYTCSYPRFLYFSLYARQNKSRCHLVATKHCRMTGGLMDGSHAETVQLSIPWLNPRTSQSLHRYFTSEASCKGSVSQGFSRLEHTKVLTHWRILLSNPVPWVI